MKRIASVLVVVLLVSLTSLMSGAQPPSNFENLKPLEWLIGDWCADFTMPYDLNPLKEGDDVTYHVSFRWIMNKNYIVMDGYMLKDGRRVPDSHEIIAWDPGKRKLVHWFCGDYGVGVGQWSDAGKAPRLRWSLGEKGEGMEATAQMEQKDADTHTWQLTDITLAGKKMPDWKVITFRRKTGAPSDDLWSAWRQASGGTWLGEGTIGRDYKDLDLSKGDRFTYRLVQKPNPEGTCIASEGDFRIEGKDVTAKVTALDYWDPDNRQIRSIGSWTNGLVEEIAIQRRQGTAFLGTYVAKSPGSAVERAGIRYDFPDPDSTVITYLDGPRKGEVLSSWKRENKH